MSLLQQLIQPRVTTLLTSNRLRDLRRQGLELWRQLGDYPHNVVVWLRVDDPYAYLLLQALPTFQQRFAVSLQLRVLRETSSDTHPEPERLAQYAAQDAAQLARHHSLDFPVLPEGRSTPDAKLSRECEHLLLRLEKSEGEWLQLAIKALHALWHGDAGALKQLVAAAPELPMATSEITRHVVENQTLQRTQGHYSSAMLHYAGEWYWGLDRIGHLQDRLSQLGLGIANSPVDTVPFSITDAATLDRIRALNARLDLYFSFRSPYSYLILARARELCDHYGIELHLRPILPMVTRGLPVPRVKRLYIVQDTKREADVLHIPFGRICDPLGRGVENCMALWYRADSEGKGQAFSEAAMRAIWSEGVDMADRRKARRIASLAGLSSKACREALASKQVELWHARIEQNRKALTAAGLWGVPAMVLRYQDQRCTTWGQDRLWAIEQALQDML